MGLGFTQENRLINITTALGPDALLLSSLTGVEGLSQLFHFTLEMVSENSENVKFEDLLGKPGTIEILLHGGASRYINGIFSKITRKERGLTFTGYTAELVPKFWLLTKVFQSRIFQHKNVPDILKEILQGHGVDAAFEIEGTFEDRDYCVQYRETDFAFVSRLMEEEGIYYFFKHTNDGHKLVLANTPQSHPDMPHMSNLIYEGDTGGWRPEERVQDWVKTQQIRSGKYTLWDSCFEMPTKSLEAQETIQESVQVGKVTHKLKVGNESLEVFDYPGGYAQRFDGIDKGGGEQSSELQKIFQDNKRTAQIRMQQEAVQSLLTYASSNYSNITAGHKFTLQRHFQDDGAYVVTEVHHDISQGGNYRSSAKQAEEDFKCHNSFTCIPAAVPYRPPLITPRPTIPGPQTAFVVGPSGEEIFTDKYGRVKVQFQWDRAGKGDADSSCWVRVAVPWAGKQWGFVAIPRIHQEVVVIFEDGDPDRPLITGSVYNADMMPPQELPANKTQSGMKSRSSVGASSENLNEIRFEDKKGEEYIFIHGEKDVNVRTKKDYYQNIEQDFHVTVDRDVFTNFKNETHQMFGADYCRKMSADYHTDISGKSLTKVGGDMSAQVAGNLSNQVGGNFNLKTDGNINLKAAGNINLDATGGVTVKASGPIVIKSDAVVSVESSGIVSINGSITKINMGPGGAALPAIIPPLAMIKKALETAQAMKAGKTGEKKYTFSGKPYTPSPLAPHPLPARSSSAAAAAPPAVVAGAPADEQKSHFIEIEMTDMDDNPVVGEEFEIQTPQGTVARGTLDDKGYARVDGIDPGTAKVIFPRLDKTVVEQK